MKRSHSTAELPAFRPVVPATSNDTEPPEAPVSDEPAPVRPAEPNGVEHAPMAFPGPLAYVPKPSAMEDGNTKPGSASSASSGWDGLGEAVVRSGSLAATRSQPHSEPAPAADGSTTSAPGAAITHATAGDDNPHGFPPLILAAFRGRLAEVKLLLEDPAVDIDQVDQKIGITALMAASCTNKPEVVACLLAARAKADLVCGRIPRTALIEASARGHVEVVKALLACENIALDATDPAGCSALFFAACENKSELVACLLAAGAKADLVCGRVPRTALMEAAFRGHIEVVKVLLACKDIAVDATDASACSALFLAACENKPEVVACLLAAGAKADLACGRTPRTALMQASGRGHVEVVKALLAREDSALDATVPGGCSALFLAACNNKPEVVACLLAAGAKVDLVCGKFPRTALMESAIRGHVDVVEALLTCRNIALDATDAFGCSALIMAASKNQPDVAARLLDAGASMTIVIRNGKTAVVTAIECENAAVLEVLLQYGAPMANVQYEDLQRTTSVEFTIAFADLDADRKSIADPEANPLGLAVPNSLDDAPAVIDELLAVLESKQDLQQWLWAKGIRMACVLPVVECLASLAGTWPVLANGAQSVNAHQKRLVSAAALSRLSVLAADGKALAHYELAGISAAGMARLSAIAMRQIEKMIAVSEQVLTSLGSAMLDKLVQDCMARTNPSHEVDVAALNASLVSAGWLPPLAQAIAMSWKSALAALESEPVSIPAGSTMKQITQLLCDNIERKAPPIFAQTMQRELAAPRLLAALRTWIGNAKSVEGLDLLFQIQCDQLRQYCEQIVSAG